MVFAGLKTFKLCEIAPHSLESKPTFLGEAILIIHFLLIVDNVGALKVRSIFHGFKRKDVLILDRPGDNFLRRKYAPLSSDSRDMAKTAFQTGVNMIFIGGYLLILVGPREGQPRGRGSYTLFLLVNDKIFHFRSPEFGRKFREKKP